MAASADIMEEIFGKASDMEEMVAWHTELLKGLTGEEEITPAAALASSQKILSYKVDMQFVKLLQEGGGRERESQAELSSPDESR